jgi:hypothetical protein
MIFFVGLHQVHDAHQFPTSFISVNRIKNRKSLFKVGNWIMDSGAFTEISTHGRYRDSVETYAAQINRWKNNGKMLAAVSQDYMCEPFILKKTGLTVLEHQKLTIERYDKLKALTDAYVLPVLQGFLPSEYAHHVRMYGERLLFGQWVGVGSICKRNSDPQAILEVLRAIHEIRPDLLLHGFGLKTTALANAEIRSHLHTADSMAWSFAARMEKRRGIGHGANSPIEAQKFVNRITSFLLNDY